MANSIELFKQYTSLLDEVYKKASCTSVLDGAEDLVREGANANELIIPKIDMDGLGDYDRNGGYVSGDVTLTNETVKCNFDRGRMFTVDAMDNIETAGLAYGKLASEFERTKVVPELDAFRLSSYCGAIGEAAVEEDLTTGEDVYKAIAREYDAMTDAEVPAENRHLFIKPTLLGLVRDLDTTKSKEVLSRFASIQEVPSGRFVSAIAQLDGKKSGEEKGGFKKAEGAKDINFMIIEKSAVIQFNKHKAPKVITPEANQDSDGWKFGYRDVSIAETYENKLAGIAASVATK